MGIKDSFWMMAHHLFPVTFQLGIVVISRQVFSRLQISDNTISIVKQNGDTVHAVTWCVNDLAIDSDTAQKAPALCTTDYLCRVLIDHPVIQPPVSEKNLIGVMH